MYILRRMYIRANSRIRAGMHPRTYVHLRWVIEELSAACLVFLSFSVFLEVILRWYTTEQQLARATEQHNWLKHALARARLCTAMTQSNTAPTGRFVPCPSGAGLGRNLGRGVQLLVGIHEPVPARTGQVLPPTAMLWRAMLGIRYSSKCLEFNAPLDVWRAPLCEQWPGCVDCAESALLTTRPSRGRTRPSHGRHVQAMDEHFKATSKQRTDTPKPVDAGSFIHLLCKTFQTYIQKSNVIWGKFSLNLIHDIHILLI